MNIVQVHGADYGGGAESVVRLHHQELLRSGHAAELVLGRCSGKLEKAKQLHYVRGPMGFRRAARWMESVFGLQNIYSPSFRALEKNFDGTPEVVHLHSLHGVENYAELNVLKRISQRFPTVVSLHDLWLMTGHCGHPLECERWKTGCGKCPDLTLYPPISRDATAWNFRRKQRAFAKCKLNLIVPSEWLKTQVMASPILSQFPVTVIHNPVDTQTFRPKEASTARSRHNIASSDRVVLMVAQHLTNPYKGIELGVECLNASQTDQLKVILVGNAAKQVSEQINAPCLVLPFTNKAAELAEYYRMADVLLMPSRGETFGLVAAEAMACGTAVVAARIGGLLDVLGNDEGGILARRTAPDMAAAVDQLLNDDALRQRKAIAGRQRCEELFSPSVHTNACLELYKNAMTGFSPCPATTRHLGS